MARRPRLGLGGYHNAALDTTGIAVAVPARAAGCVVSVSAGCYFDFADVVTLSTFNDTNYGSLLSGGPHVFDRQNIGGGSEDYIHIAAWATTAIVAIAFF